MALNIPMPGLPGDALLKGLNTGSTLFSRYMQPIIQREQLAEQGKYHQGSLAEQSNYHGGMLKHYEDQLKQQAIQQAQQMALARQQESRLGANSAIERQVANARLQKLMREADPKSQVAYMQQLLQGLRQQNGQNNGLNQQNETMNPFSGGGMPSIQEMGNHLSNVSAPSQETLQQGFNNLSPDERMTLEMMGYKIPKPYETPEQKTQREIEKAGKINEIKINQKETKEIEDTVKPVLQAATHLQALKKILKEKPNRTGPIAGRFSNAPILSHFYDDATIKAINAHSVPLQGEIAGKLATRPGFGVLKIAESAKPGATNTQEGNEASVMANVEAIIDSFNQMKEQYERVNPDKKFPYQLPEDFEKNPFEKKGNNNNPAPSGHTWIISPKGKKIAIPNNEVKDALKAGGKRG